MRPQESWLTFPLKKKKNHVHCLCSYSSIQRHKSTLLFFSFGVIFIIVTGILLAIFHSINYVSLVNFFLFLAHFIQKIISQCLHLHLNLFNPKRSASMGFSVEAGSK